MPGARNSHETEDYRPKVQGLRGSMYEIAVLTPYTLSLKPRGRRARAGLSLLEVLISMFVMLVGLLGVASLIPVGKVEAQRGNKIDRAAACGRAAFREVQIRGMLKRAAWARPDNGNAVYTEPGGVGTYTWNGTLGGTDFSAFALDPYGVGVVGDAQSLGQWFPYSATTPAAVTLPRLTLGPGMDVNARAALADAIFRWQDDLNFNTPDNADLLPSQMLDSNARRQSVGDYSWLTTVVPDPRVVGTHNMFDVPMRVSIAVFYKRNRLVPTSGAAEGERVCKLAALSGDSEIILTTAGAAPLTTDPAEHLKIAKPGQWLMIAGPVNIDTDNDGVSDVQRNDFRWYRIASADEIETVSGNYQRRLTVVGPDWIIPPAQMTDFLDKARVFLFDGIIAVYEKNMKLEVDSMYQ